MPFAVTRTSAVPKAKKSPSARRPALPPRCDVDMKAQYRAAYVDSRNKLQQALINDYQTTVGTRTKHAHFLYQILNEVQRYQLEAYGHRIPDLALRILAEELSGEMADIKEDHYCECLVKIGRHKVYSAGFKFTAVEMMEKYYRQRPNASATSSVFSQGMSDEESAKL